MRYLTVKFSLKLKFTFAIRLTFLTATENSRFPYIHVTIYVGCTVKGKLRSKKLSSYEREWKLKKNDLNAPNDSRDIFPLESQEFGQDGHRHFVDFQPHFHLNMTSQTQCCKTMKKWKCDISGVFCLICLRLCRLLELGREHSLDFKFCCNGNQNQNYCLLLKTQKVYCLSKNDDQKVIWNNTVWLLLQVVSSFEEKLVIHSSYCEKTIVFCFSIKANYSRWVAIATKFKMKWNSFLTHGSSVGWFVSLCYNKCRNYSNALLPWWTRLPCGHYTFFK